MSYRLRVSPVRSVSRLKSSLSPGRASEHGAYDGEMLVVDSLDVASELVRTCHNVEWVDGEPTDYYCGVNDCQRTVDNPDDTCWQHD